MMNLLSQACGRVYSKAVTYWYDQYRRYKKYIDRLTVNRQIEYWKSHHGELLRTSQKGYRLKLCDLGLSPECLAMVQDQHCDGCEVVIADVDKNGLLWSRHGAIAGAPNAAAGEFIERERFRIQIVARNGYVGARKNFAGRRINFINELKILHTLGARGCHIPAILHVDLENLTLTTSYIPGQVLRNELASHGAELHAHYSGKRNALSPAERRQVRSKRAEEGLRFLADLIDESFVEKLYQEICRIHAAGVVDIDIKYGNIIVERKTKQPYLIDFDHATFYPDLSQHALQILGRRDIAKFNLFFGMNKPMPKSIWSGIKSPKLSIAFFAFATSLSILMQSPLSDLVDYVT